MLQDYNSPDFPRKIFDLAFQLAPNHGPVRPEAAGACFPSFYLYTAEKWLLLFGLKLPSPALQSCCTAQPDWMSCWISLMYSTCLHMMMPAGTKLIIVLH